MPLHVKSIAVSIAVVCFFGLGFICWISGLSPFICCKRALFGAAISYIATALGVKVINAVLTAAMITNHVNRHISKAQLKQKDKTNDVKG